MIDQEVIEEIDNLRKKAERDIEGAIHDLKHNLGDKVWVNVTVWKSNDGEHHASVDLAINKKPDEPTN